MMCYIMHRTQLLLEQWQYQSLRARAESEGKSLSALVRGILTEYLSGNHRPSRLRELRGIAKGPGNLGRDHDDYIDDEP